MTEDEQGEIYDAIYEMRGLAATLLAASRGDLQEPEKVVEYAAAQVFKLAGDIATAISGSGEKPTS